MRTRSRNPLGLALLVVFSLLAAACSSDRNDAAGERTTEESATTTTEVAASTGDEQIIALIRAASALSYELQLEAVLSENAMAAEGADATIAGELTQQREQTDAAADGFLAYIGGLTAADGDIDEAAAPASEIDSAERRIESLKLLRTAVDESTISPGTARGNFMAVSESFIFTIRASRPLAQSPALANQTIDIVLLENYRSTAAEIAGLLSAATQRGSLLPEEINELETLIAERSSRQQEFEELASSENKAVLRNNSRSESAVNRELQNVLNTASGQTLSVTNDEWRAVAIAHLGDLFTIETVIIDNLTASTSTVVDPSGDDDLVELVDASVALAHELQLEAMLTVSSMEAEGTDAKITADLTDQRIQTDAAAEDFLSAKDRTEVNSAPNEGRSLGAALSSAEYRITDLDSSRSLADEFQITTKIVRSNYADSVIALLSTTVEAQRNAGGTALALQLFDMVLISGYKSTSAEMDALLAAATQRGAMTAEDIDDLETLMAQQLRQRLQFDGFASPVGKALVRANSTSEVGINTAIRDVLYTPAGEPLPTANDEWRELAVAHLEGLRAAESAMIADTRAAT